MKPVFRNLFVVMSGLVLALFMAEVALRVLNRYEPPLVKDYVYVVAILDWRVSNSMDADFRVDALGEAVSRYGAPDIFNFIFVRGAPKKFISSDPNCSGFKPVPSVGNRSLLPGRDHVISL